jgi:polysaccharide pyruvyl transferase WcaK-like protein
MRLVAIGDIGVVDGMIHVGDEAMFEALVLAMRARAATAVTGLSSAPADSAERYGVEAVRPIGFAPASGRGAMTERLARVTAVAGGDARALPADDPVHAVVAAVADADGVVVAGGGNMASTWPMHVFERAALGRIAAALGRPLVVSGQTLGPDLSAEDAALVAELLAGARLVGLREDASDALAAGLGIESPRRTRTPDDAAFLPSGSEPTPDEPYCLVTLARHVGDADPAAAEAASAALLDEVAASTGLRIVFSAHFGSLRPGEVRGDDAVHAGVAARMRAAVSVEPVVDARRSAALARNAALVVSSRYHPAVFAASAAVPVVGVAVDEYTRVKLTGALGTSGQASVVALGEVLDGRARARVADVWAARDRIRSEGSAVALERRADAERWWDRVADVLSAGARRA